MSCPTAKREDVVMAFMVAIVIDHRRTLRHYSDGWITNYAELVDLTSVGNVEGDDSLTVNETLVGHATRKLNVAMKSFSWKRERESKERSVECLDALKRV